MSGWLWGVALVVLIMAVRIWNLVRFNRVVAELARRPEREFQVAGIDRATELHRVRLLGTGYGRMRRLRRQLDKAAADIARLEASQGPGETP